MPPRKPTSPKPLLTWQGQPDLVGLQFTLQPLTTCTLPSNYTYWLHAWFLDQIRQIDPTTSAFLHDNQTEKAFTLSGFLGHTETTDRTFTFFDSELYTCQITALCPAVCLTFQQWLQQWFQPGSPSPLPQIKLRGGSFQLRDAQISLPATTYAQLWDNSAPVDALTFLSPTSFRKSNHHMPLPIPENLFHSYLRRWNTFAHLEFDSEDFLQWINEYLVIVRHELRSRKVQPGKQGSVTGFVGTLQLALTPKAKQEPEYVQLVHTLLSAAPYFGTGHKVTFGLGQTRLGWTPLFFAAAVTSPVSSVASVSSVSSVSSVPPVPPVPPVPQTPLTPSVPPTSATVVQLRKELIKTRTAELEPQFMAARKRQGGDRAKNIAHLWATIVAHQEAGDSLKAIAADLNLPYDTVKKYAQLARKQMAQWL